MADGCADLAPAKAHPDDAAFDLRSRAELELPPGRSVLVPTGLFIELPPGYEAQVRPRSGLALRHNLMLTNSPGTIDAGYRGEVGVCFRENLIRLQTGKRSRASTAGRFLGVHGLVERQGLQRLVLRVHLG